MFREFSRPHVAHTIHGKDRMNALCSSDRTGLLIWFLALFCGFDGSPSLFRVRALRRSESVNVSAGRELSAIFATPIRLHERNPIFARTRIAQEHLCYRLPGEHLPRVDSIQCFSKEYVERFSPIGYRVHCIFRLPE